MKLSFPSNFGRRLKRNRYVTVASPLYDWLQSRDWHVKHHRDVISMQFDVLGPIRITDGNGTRPVTGTRQRILLAALLAHAKQPMSAGKLAEFVWDGKPPARPVSTLRTYLTRLRQELGPVVAARIRTVNGGYLAEVGPGELDVLAFEALCRKAGTAAGTADWTAVADHAAAALALWRGDPLEDVPSQMLRGRWLPGLEQQHLQAAEWQAEAWLQLGRHEQLIQRLRQLTAEHPLRERFHAQLMRALACCGRQAEALAVYRDARKVLVEELGIDPGPELRGLHKRILDGDDALSAQPPGALAPETLAAPAPGVPAPVTASVPGAPRQLPGAPSSAAWPAPSPTLPPRSPSASNGPPHGASPAPWTCSSTRSTQTRPPSPATPAPSTIRSPAPHLTATIRSPPEILSLRQASAKPCQGVPGIPPDAGFWPNAGRPGDHGGPGEPDLVLPGRYADRRDRHVRKRLVTCWPGTPGIGRVLIAAISDISPSARPGQLCSWAG